MPGCRILIAGLLIGLSIPPVHAFDDSAVFSVEYPLWFKQTFYDLHDDLDEAQAQRKHGVMLFFST